MKGKKIAIIGGGAAGFFAAIRLGKTLPPESVHIFEKTNKVLSKVKVSGGGRCNVTHACFNPAELVQFYPRGMKELRGPFSKFGPTDTIEWFKNRGVALKTEPDGRVFPESDSSQTIIDTFLKETNEAGIEVHLSKTLTDFNPIDNKWSLVFNEKEEMLFDAVFIAPGSSSSLWKILESKGVQIIPPVPSLFTFNISNKDLHALSGLSIPKVRLSITGKKNETEGPLLFTHWGMSGPAILKLSSFEARYLHQQNYRFDIELNFIPDVDDPENEINEFKRLNHRKQTGSISAFSTLPKRFWHFVLQKAEIDEEKNWADISNQKLERLIHELTEGIYKVNGKSVFKDEFVTAGGVSLKEINFSDYSCRKLPGVFLGGEFLDVDAVTGGFNFQHAWTSGYLAAEGILNYIKK